MTTLEIAFTPRFWSSAEALPANEVKQVVKAVKTLAEDPRSEALRLKPVESDPRRRTYTCRASRDIRLLGFRTGNTLLLERAGHHDEIYRLARRLDLVVNAGAGRIVVVDLEGGAALPSTLPAPPDGAAETGPGIFDHWGDADLRAAGFDDDMVAAIRACRTEDDLLALDVDDDTKWELIDLLSLTPEQWRAPAIDPEAEAAERFRRAITSYGAVSGLSPLFSPQEVAKLAAAPIEDWMIFLHPDQRAVVERRYEGPARVRGSAGTGKTVVALHRAAALVRRFASEEPAGAPRTVLFTTFIRSLPPVFEQLYRRLPNTRDDDDIEFVNVHSLALRICADAGARPRIDEQAVERAFAAAFKTVVTPGSALAKAGVTPGYLRDEITHVVKGRGLRDLEEYLDLERVGRRMPFSGPMRREVWRLREEWDREMAARGVVDFPDVILRALELVRSELWRRYRAVIVDEAQDLTLASLELLRALVSGPDGREPADGLLIVGDGAQKIYPGGFTLRQAGVEVRGRTTVLRVNYRNTRAIIDAAMAVAGAETVDDMGDVYQRDAAAVAAARPGARPVFVQCRGPEQQAEIIAGRIRDVVGDGAVGYGDIAVAVPTNKKAEMLRRGLAAQGIPTIALEEYSGHTVDKVKVGTHFRIKGLEFKLVFLPFLGERDGGLSRRPEESDEEWAERQALEVSRLFVAMTRARDALIVLGTGKPGPLVARGAGHFEVIVAAGAGG